MLAPQSLVGARVRDMVAVIAATNPCLTGLSTLFFYFRFFSIIFYGRVVLTVAVRKRVGNGKFVEITDFFSFYVFLSSSRDA